MARSSEERGRSESPQKERRERRRSPSDSPVRKRDKKRRSPSSESPKRKKDKRHRSRSRSRSPARRRSRSRERGRERSSRGGRETGVAGRWNEKGFGFITPDNGGPDVFCHVSAIMDGKWLNEGARVEYNKTYDEFKGKDRAEQVTGGCNDPEPRDMGYGGGSGDRGGHRGGYDRDRGGGYGDRERGGYGDRGGYSDRGGGGSDMVRPGDWECPTCGLNVFASKTSCFKCGTTKPRPGESRGGGGRRGRSRSRS